MSMCRCAPEAWAARSSGRRRRAASRWPRSGRVGAQHRRERRHLHAHVGPRQRPDPVGLEHRPLGPAAGGRGELLDRVQAALGVAIGLGLGDGGLAEQVHRAGHAALPQLAQRPEGGGGGLADDEAMGQVAHPAGGRRPQRGAPRARARHPHGHRQRRGRLGHLLQVADEVAGEIVQRAARRHHVDEAKQRRPQLAVAGGHLHGARVEGLERLARGGRERRRERLADLAQLGLHGGVTRSHRDAHGQHP